MRHGRRVASVHTLKLTDVRMRQHALTIQQYREITFLANLKQELPNATKHVPGPVTQTLLLGLKKDSDNSTTCVAGRCSEPTYQRHSSSFKVIKSLLSLTVVAQSKSTPP